MAGVTATIITIGDELLIGQTIDTNSAWIAQQLNAIGVAIGRRVAVADTRSAILKALNEEQREADILLITGGLGPTSDDITKPLLCEYFEGKMVRDARVENHIRELFTRLNRPIIERNMMQADVPDVCTVLFNRMGTAPGMWFERAGKIFVSMPGVPVEMMVIMQDEVLPRLRTGVSSETIIHKTTVTAGEGESFIAEKLMGFESRLPAYIGLAYLPDFSIVKLRLTGSGTEATQLDTEMSALQAELTGILGGIVVATEDLTMEQLLGRALAGSGLRIGIAESCTGGYIGHCITQVSGSSEYFMGSVVSYDNSVKEGVLQVPHDILEQHGAVSEETAVAMARGALRVLDVDYALATTGVLGPGGGTDRVKVGTVCMAVASREEIDTRVFHFRYDRQRNKEIAAKMAMLFLWKFITGKL